MIVSPAPYELNYGTKIWCSVAQDSSSPCKITSTTIWTVNNLKFPERINKIVVSADSINDNMLIYLNGSLLANACPFNTETYYQEFPVSNLKSSDQLSFVYSNVGCYHGSTLYGEAGAWLKNLKIKILYRKN